MTATPPDEPAAPEPTEPTADDGVRRLLAQARETEPMPPAVAARLDLVLDELATTGVGTDPRLDTPVADLAGRRRRRALALLVAAVAVVAVGLTANGLRGEDGGADSAAPDSSGARTDPADPTTRSGSESSSQPGQPSQPDQLDGAGGSQEDRERQGLRGGDDPSQNAPESGDSDARGLAQVVRPTAFARDVRRLRTVAGTRVGSAGEVVGERDLAAGPGFVCSPPTAYGTGKLVPVRYRGGAAVLAYRVPSRQSQTVDLLQCGTAQVLRSTTVPRG